MSKRIKKDLPRYSDALTKKLKEWKKESGEDFAWKGESYEARMNVQETGWQQYKENQAAEKLHKKQQEKARYSGVGAVKALPGQKKKSMGVASKPLVDSRNRENSMS